VSARHEVSAPRVAVLIPFWEFWESSARGDLRAHLRDVGDQAIAALSNVNVVSSDVLVAAEDAAGVARRIRASASDVLVVLQVMGVPPARTMSVLDELPDLPVVVWGLHLARELNAGEERYDHSDITTEGATVGTTQLVTMLVRQSRPLSLHVGHVSDAEATKAVERSIRAAWAARRIARGTLARVGREPAGYDCVVCDVAQLGAALGLQVVEVEPAEIARRFREVGRSETQKVEAEVASTFDVPAATAPDAEGLDRSLRFAAVLESLDDELGIDAGAINCHIPELRFSSEVGIAPCYALGRETTRGIPWACAGDMLTAVALLTTKLLGGAALYHELETIDYETDELVIANTGEHDLAWADPSTRPVLRANGWFSSDPICGACACFSPPPGAATLVAFVPHPAEASGFRYIVAEGSFGPRSFSGAGTPNAAFRFRERGSVDGFTAWALAGASHHSSSTPGHFGDAVARVAEYLRIGCVRIS
jgi:L-fucose isomerase-like protein